jgi:tRNA (guanine37-N1)-methyltransferase
LIRRPNRSTGKHRLECTADPSLSDTRMRIDIVTVFPEMVEAALDFSIVKRARERNLVEVNVVNLRDFTVDRHHTTDDVPYGGGGGMVMKVEPIGRAIDHVSAGSASGPRIILTDPRGQKFTQTLARRWASEQHIVILCGHYEGVDERVRQYLVTDEVSIGDYVLTGGELPALVITDAVTRLQAGAIGDPGGAADDTFEGDLLEYPHYTRPSEYLGHQVPEILLCGHHAQIVKWRRWHQLHATMKRRPDLFALLELTEQDRKLMHEEEPKAPPAKYQTQDSVGIEPENVPE